MLPNHPVTALINKYLEPPEIDWIVITPSEAYRERIPGGTPCWLGVHFGSALLQKKCIKAVSLQEPKEKKLHFSWIIHSCEWHKTLHVAPVLLSD